MEVKVLFDKKAMDKPLRTGWGLSVLVNDKVLFDTGENGDWLIENMYSLGVDIKKIEAVVISHDHWDHWGGLWNLLQRRKGVSVYICPNFSHEFKDKAAQFGANLIEAEGVTQILPDIFTTGEIAGTYHGNYMAEQAMVLKTSNGLTVITGCAHPGILKMLEKAKTGFPDERIYLVLGGFHLMKSDARAIESIVEGFQKLGVVKAGSTHCSGETAEDIFKRAYGANFVELKVGQALDI